MPFDDTSRARESLSFVLPAPFVPASDPSEPTPRARSAASAGGAFRRHALHWGTLSAGLALMFSVLMATKLGHFMDETTCTFAAALVLAVWVCSGVLRRDGKVFGWGATLCLLPVIMIECNWVPMPRDGAALAIETLCVALLFAGNLRRLGQEIGASLLDALDSNRGPLAHT